MSETSATAVLEEPTTKAAPASAPATAPAPKLVRGRDEACAHIQNQLQKGAEVKALRIRSGPDLDQARAAKLEWTARTTELLNDLFDTPFVAEQCNDWVGRIYPEYAEFGNFVEQFYAEMDHRLARLKSVLKFVEKFPAQARAVVPTPAVPPPAPVIPGAVVAAPQLQVNVAGLLVVRKADEACKQAVAEFLESLDIELSVASEAPDLAAELDRNHDLVFAVVLSGEPQNDQFELGFCAGRLGLNRVILLNAQAGASPTDARGLTHLSLDTGGGWQLQLAKHLRRAGVNVDLNRLC